MKLLIITDAWHPQVNGVVRTYEHLIEELEKNDHEIKVIGPTDFSVNLPMPGYSEIRLVMFPYERMKPMINAFNPDHIHIATEGALGWAGRYYCLRRKISFTTAYHTHFPDYIAKRLAKYLPFLYGKIHNIAKKFIKRFHDPSTLIMIATQSLEDTLKEWDFKPPMYRFTRGAKLDQFHLGKKTIFKTIKAPVALYVGRVAIEKNLEEFLKMHWEGSKVIVGKGPALSSLRRKYPYANFVGVKKGAELAEHYRSADIFVFPSRTDTFGMVIVEALACGLPVAAFNVMGPKDIVTEDFLGSLHETDLAEAARTALKHRDPEKCSQHIQKYYTWEYAARQFEDALKAEKELFTKT